MSGLVEIEVHENIEDFSNKIKDSSFLAYVSLHGVFQGMIRVGREDLSSSLSEVVSKSENRCFYIRLGMKINGDWDEAYVLVCNGVLLGVNGEIRGREVSGSACLEEVVNGINSGRYSKGLIEITEIPVKFVEERLGVDVSSLGKPKPRLPPPPSKERRLVTEEKPTEIERLVEEATTIPIETSISRTETLVPHVKPPAEERITPSPVLKPPEIPVPEAISKKPVVIEELSIALDKPIIDFTDRLVQLASGENIGISSAVVSGDMDRLDVEVSIARLGITRKREKMLRLAESIANILSDILVKQKASQKEIAIVVRHGYEAVKFTKRIG
ncbi:MAG: hypothetical protein QXT47_02655 [Desulfurococcaceae archaeon]